MTFVSLNKEKSLKKKRETEKSTLVVLFDSNIFLSFASPEVAKDKLLTWETWQELQENVLFLF